jgi:hypothetical protein
MIAASDLKSSLSHFTGTARYIRDPFTGLLHTDEIEHPAQRAEDHRLVSDLGAVYRNHPKVKGISFQLRTLIVDKNNKSVLTCREDCDIAVIYEQNY